MRQGLYEVRRAQVAEGRQGAPLPPLPGGAKFELLLADPPWRYGYSVVAEGQAVEAHYPTLSLEELCAMPVPSVCAADCLLYLWSTAPKQVEAHEVLKAWGFRYVTQLIWAKTYSNGRLVHGMGYHAAICHEVVLIGKRGRPGTPPPAARQLSIMNSEFGLAEGLEDQESIFWAERGVHSRKPEILYERIERMHPQKKKLELFARQQRPGWAAWGLEAPAE